MSYGLKKNKGEVMAINEIIDKLIEIRDTLPLAPQQNDITRGCFWDLNELIADIQEEQNG